MTDERRRTTRGPRAQKAPRTARISARGAEGRERGLVEQAGPSWLTLALDAIQRHRATSSPLDKTLAELSRARRVGARTRRAASDALFAWARQRTVVEREIDDALAREGGVPPRRRQRDHAGVLLAIVWSELTLDDATDGALPEVLTALVDAARSGEISAPPAELPAWLTKRLVAQHGTEGARALVDALAVRAPVTLAIDPRAIDESRALLAVQALGVDATLSPHVKGAIRSTARVPLGKLDDALRSALWPMDDGSQLVALALGASPGERVLDLCAGGGGKTRYLATRGADIVALDVDQKRIAAARARVPGVRAVRADGRTPPFAKSSFDRVLVDAPCSGTGTLRRAPDLAARIDDAFVARTRAIAKELLVAALELVRPGGLVVYATCSLLDEENGSVIDEVLAECAHARPAPLQGLANARSAVVRERASDARVAFLPTTHGTDGFFVAGLTRA